MEKPPDVHSWMTVRESYSRVLERVSLATMGRSPVRLADLGILIARCASMPTSFSPLINSARRAVGIRRSNNLAGLDAFHRSSTSFEFPSNTCMDSCDHLYVVWRGQVTYQSMDLLKNRSGVLRESRAPVWSALPAWHRKGGRKKQ